MAQVLGQLGEAGPWHIRTIGQGAQGSAHVVSHAQGRPIAGESRVVVKIYHTPDDLNENASHEHASKAALRQHTVMQLFHDHVNGRTSGGWLLRAPRPLLVSEKPPALVIGWVPGMPLGQLLQGRQMCDPAEIRSAAEAMLFGLNLFWSRCGRLYGDLSMNNVLCEPTTRTLSFIDSGVDEDETWSAHRVSRNWHPASRDLGYQLLNGAASLKIHLTRLRRWRWRMRMSEELLRAFRNRLPDEPARREFIDEVRRCSVVHLHKIETSASPSGLWRRLVRYIASIWIERVLRHCMEPSSNQSQPGHGSDDLNGKEVRSWVW